MDLGTMSDQNELSVHLESHQSFDVQSRLQFLEKLQRKAQRGLLILEKSLPADGDRAQVYHTWVYISSLLRCVIGKWQKITQEEFQEVAYLHDKCLIKALLRNIHTGRSILAAKDKSGSAVGEWDELWSAVCSKLYPSGTREHALCDDFHELDRRK